jgi:hypothetical protein
LGGYAEVIAPFVDKPLRFPPRFFGVNKPLTLRLQAALQMNYEFAPA